MHCKRMILGLNKTLQWKLSFFTLHVRIWFKDATSASVKDIIELSL